MCLTLMGRWPMEEFVLLGFSKFHFYLIFFFFGLEDFPQILCECSYWVFLEFGND